MAADPSPRTKDVRHRTTAGNRFRFLVRVLGLTGLLAAPTGLVLAGDALPAVPESADPAAMSAAGDRLLALARGEAGPLPQAGAIALAAGVVAVAVWLLVELLGGLFLAAGRKTAVGTNAAAQTALAVALLVVVNAVSFAEYRRWDLTRDRQFTLSPDLVAELKTLRPDSPTTVVVLQLHKTAGTLSDKPDAYDYAAERKVVEKVRDLVDQLREFGPRFNVAVLDVEDEGYERAVRDLTRRRPGLAEAIAAAPENSIFFYADGKVRRVPRAQPGSGAAAPDPDAADQALVYPGAVTRVGFADFLQLDKTASREVAPADRPGLAGVLGGPAFAPGVRGPGNLVLLPRGKEAFVRKVLALEERRPRVALAVIHPVLTSREEAYDGYTAAGMRKTLEANGFEVVDVILKKGWSRRGEPSPAAYTYEESELDRVEARYNLLGVLTADRELAVKLLSDAKAEAEKGLAEVAAAQSEEDRARAVAAAARPLQRLVRGRITTADQVAAVLASLAQSADAFRQEQAEFAKQLADAGARYKDLLGDERAVENRREADVKAKLRQYVGDCDLLVVPRLTVVDIARGDVIPPALFNLSKDQADAVKEFVKAGKPVLFAVGPGNVDRRGGLGADAGGDDVEKLLPRLGIELGRQTILTDAEATAIAERQNETLGSGVDVPPLAFDVPGPGGKAPNPVAEAFRVTARAVDRRLDVRRGGFRPVYVAAGAAARLPFAAEVAHTGRDSWNEDKPVPDDDAVPKFDPAKPDDPKKGTRDEERRGPFPVGAAVEAPVPVEWFDDRPAAAQAAAAAGLLPVLGPVPPGLLPLAADPAAFAPVVPADKRPSPPAVRVVALGHGGLFTGKRLDPAHETLLLHTVNWQLRRDDRLPHDVPDDQKWRFPRSSLGPQAARAWTLGAAVGLPALAAYLGVIALMVRRVR